MANNFTLFVYKWLPIIFHCHQRDDRSFIVGNRKFPICSRCTGELVGIVLSIFIQCFVGLPGIALALVLLLPLILDGFIQLLTKYESNNMKRFITGLLFGMGLYSLLIYSTLFFYNQGLTYGASIFNK